MRPFSVGQLVIVAVFMSLSSSAHAADPITSKPWPAVVTGDDPVQFGKNLSGLFYEPGRNGAPAVLWAVQNKPAKIYRLLFNGTVWAPDTANDWGAGKTLRYPAKNGDPDTEGVTWAELGTSIFYTATERDNHNDKDNRFSILRFDASAADTVLTATQEWNLTDDLPEVGEENKGLEAITWIPDTYLVSKGFLDDNGVAYDPASYPSHSFGLFIVGVEATGKLYAYLLPDSGDKARKIATFSSSHPQVMGLEFDRDTGALWAACDNNCCGTQNVLGIVDGKFEVRRRFTRPSNLPDSNYEGIALAPESECSGGFKNFFWSDDDDRDNYSLRVGSIPCGPLPGLQ